RMGGARNDPQSDRERRRREEGRRRVDGHQPARALVLPREVPNRLTADGVQHLAQALVTTYNRRMIPSKVIRQAAAAAIAAAAACGGGSSSSTSPTGTCTPSANPNTIVIQNNQVCPQTLTVTIGSQVTFVNNDSRVHEMDSDPHP